MITKKHSTFTFQETIFWDGLSFVTWCASLLKGCPLSATILGYALVFKWCNVCKENSPHNITTPPAWTADTRQDGLMDSDVTAEIETHQKRRVFFPILYCSMLVSQCKLCPWFAVFRWQEWTPVWSSAPIAYPLYYVLLLELLLTSYQSSLASLLWLLCVGRSQWISSFWNNQ